MPDNTYPPFSSDVGGSISPRQLNRWIDVSPQGGSLKRTQSYIELPVFNQAVDWKGYSEIIATYNFAGPNNFVLTDISDLPLNPNYVLCIAYQLAGVVYRYKLCGDGGVFYFTLTDYIKQPIKHNFRLEVWSVANANVSQATAVQLFTSVRGSFDYRFGSDFELVDNSGIVTDFQCVNDKPATLLAGYRLAFDGTTANADYPDWKSGSDVLTPTGVSNVGTVGPYTASAWEIDVGAYFSNGAFAGSWNVAHIFTTFQTTCSTGVLYAQNDITVGFNSATELEISTSTGTTTLTMVANTLYTLEVSVYSDITYVRLYTILGDLVDESTIAASVEFQDSLSIGAISTDQVLNVMAHIVYPTTLSNEDRFKVIRYLTEEAYAPVGSTQISLPFAFPSNAAVPNNT
jgi:hypothetical protein